MDLIKSKTLFINTGGGATSCVSVRLHDTCLYFEKNGFWPHNIDSSQQFEMFQQENKIDFSKVVFGEYKKPNQNEFINFNHGWQYGWYYKLELSTITNLANKVCPLSSQVLDKSFEFWNRIIDRAAILYRGNDKQLEVAKTDYKTMLKMGLDSGQQSWIVQTDEIEFYQFWKTKFPDTIRFSELPLIQSHPTSYAIGENRSQFLIDFLAALKAISMAPILLTTTGNTGLWTLIFRGNCKNVYQAWGDNPEWKKYSS